MRLFIAINPDPETRSGIFSAVEPLRSLLPDARWVAPQLLHMTVKFLGSRTKEEAEKVATLLDGIAASYRKIPYDIGGMGAFPNLRRPDVVWMGVQGDAKLELINHDVERACAGIGVPIDGRPFRPHITVGRVRSATPRILHAFAPACASIDHQAHSWVHSLDLMLSHYQDQRLAYSVLHSATLERE
jgi:2'-5' RNA ligase